MKETAGKYATDVITSCAFGIESNCLLNPNSEFREFGRQIVDFTVYRCFEFMSFFMLPFAVKHMDVTFFSRKTTAFLRKAFWETMSEREEKKIVRNDFMDLLLQLKNEGRIAIDKNDDEMKVIDNDDEIFDENEVFETLRKYPPLPVLDRTPNIDYTIPGTDVILEKNTPVYISLMGLHNDPEVYPDPDDYDPERFNVDNKRARHPFMYLPFGEGPKYCIGKQFGLMASKVGLVSILSQFEVSPCEGTPETLTLNPRAFIIAAKGGIPLKFTPLKK
ncbi:Cytochrome P450 6l1 [Blattella germanica]|nr:Cytochrome P450 6l1 [Blattella germanica]